ncbi:MAG TPA: GNAT family N-acetyltransferase [Rhizomicrobium sp.]|jgi:CelD/BcsL family acetyltransferase involved in cellulose biosynthesis
MIGGPLEIVTGVERLPAFVPEWRDLWTRCGHTPFQSPDWLVPWWDVFAPGALRILVLRAGDRLVAVAPLYGEKSGGSARLLPLGVSLSDYHDVLIDSDRVSGKETWFADALAAMDNVAECEFPELAPGAEALRLTAPEDWSDTRAPASVCPVLTLPAKSDELRLHVRPSRLRHVKTAHRRAARRGDAVLIEGDSDNVEALLSELVRLHQERWQRGGEPGVFADSRVAEFHAAALPGLMEQNLARLYALEIGGKTAGVYYGFVWRGRAYAYLCGYDPAFSFESPGAILIGHAIEEAVREGAREFDFLRGGESYKYDWGAQDRHNTRRVLARKSR